MFGEHLLPALMGDNKTRLEPGTAEVWVVDVNDNSRPRRLKIQAIELCVVEDGTYTRHTITTVHPTKESALRHAAGNARTYRADAERYRKIGWHDMAKNLDARADRIEAGMSDAMAETVPIDPTWPTHDEEGMKPPLVGDLERLGLQVTSEQSGQGRLYVGDEASGQPIA